MVSTRMQRGWTWLVFLVGAAGLMGACRDEGHDSIPQAADSDRGATPGAGGSAGGTASGARCSAQGSLYSCNTSTGGCITSTAMGAGYGASVKEAGAVAVKNCAENMQGLIRIAAPGLVPNITAPCAVISCEYADGTPIPPQPSNLTENPCNLDPQDRETEPNDKRTEPNPYVLGQNMKACLGTSSDTDVFELTVPAGETGTGYFDAALTDIGPGSVQAYVWRIAPDGKEFLFDRMFPETTKERQPYYFVWPAAPGYRYRVDVGIIAEHPDGSFSYSGDPLPYTFNAVYHKVDGASGASEVEEQATAIALNTPVTGLLFTASRDIAMNWFSIALMPGPVTFKFDAGTTMDVHLPDLRPSVQGISEFPGQLRWTVRQASPAGGYKVGLQGSLFKSLYHTKSRNEVPPEWQKPYRFTVTQP
jgi:hypothetical protein